MDRRPQGLLPRLRYLMGRSEASAGRPPGAGSAGGRRRRLDGFSRAALRRVLEHPKFEVLPLKGVLDQVDVLPEGAQVSVTASPTKTMEDTLNLAADLRQKRFDVVPHLSARMTHDRSHLAALLRRMEDLEISRVFLVGGDAPQRGDFRDSFSLLQAMEEMGHHLTDLGVPSYPEGHSQIPDGLLRQDLHNKQPHASYMTTQMCFDGRAIADFLADCRADGIALPARIGIPGVGDRLKLMKISTRIGVGQSVRFLTKHRGMLGSFVRPGGYTPEKLLRSLAPAFTDPEAAVIGVHIYTFNQCETTERWRQEYLERL